MSVQLITPEQLTQVVEHLMMDASKKLELNKRMANRARQFFRAQIRAQRDIEGHSYQPRTRRKRIAHGRMRGNTQNNQNMLMGLSRSLRTEATPEHFCVGLSGVAGRIGLEHNQGSQLSFTTRVRGFFNSHTGRWEGGTRVKNNYQLPRRTFLGWTPELEQTLLLMAAEYLTQSAKT